MFKLHSTRTGSLIFVQVTLQHDTLEGVVAGDAYYGATIGRVCNRIAGAVFSGEDPRTRTEPPPEPLVRAPRARSRLRV